MSNILDEVVAAGKPLYDKATRHAIRMNKIANRVNKRRVPLGYIERDGNFYLPSEYVEPRPHREYITRYHNTMMDNVPSIIENGLLLNKFGNGYGGVSFSDEPMIFTTSRPIDSKKSTYRPSSLSSNIELRIPKKDYVNMERSEVNPETDYYFHPYVGNPTPYRNIDDSQRLLTSIQHGGRTDIFKDDIDPRYIYRICNDVDDCYSPEEWIEKFGR